MEKKKRLSRTASVLLFLGVFLFSGGISMNISSSFAADPALEAKKVVETSRLTLESFMADPANKEFQNLIKKAQGVYITPSLLKGAFVVGVSGGNGVLLVRDKDSGKWMGPAFYTLGGASFGTSGRRGSLGGGPPDYDRTRG